MTKDISVSLERADIQLTDSARERIAALLKTASGPVAGVRLSTPKRGCSGFGYAVDYVEAPKAGDHVVETSVGRLFVAQESVERLSGLVMDWQEDDFVSGFVFQNPNAKGACGCGESFTV